jgi:hypothetical protein
VTQGRGYVFVRELDGKMAVSAFNAGPSPITMTLSSETFQSLTAAGAEMVFEVQVGPEVFPGAMGGSFQTGDKIDLRGGDVEITLPGMSGAILLN